ncbi:hypothetical protein [Paenibacillus piri]|uniref:Periplasmic protein n=1 Tax=Paenibacillus piri TaxID=2547395 RepID=A0A4V2ZTT1_9BACL|nr:hypothetical protein [Paenibacillus piri]TDF98324.1 hypothetical protein E1757_12620 [Paenibacillus piri]
MRDRTIDRSNSSEPFYVTLGDKNVADIVITNHARIRWTDRVENQKTGFNDICDYLWDRLRAGQIKPYYKNSEDVYLIDDDMVMVAEFAGWGVPETLDSKLLHRMVIVTFLGRMSDTIELRDLKSYYSWLRHSRRMTLIKSSRKRR